MSANKRCPNCNTYTMERIRRSTAMKILLGWLPLRPYRCWKCYHKAMLFRFPDKSAVRR